MRASAGSLAGMSVGAGRSLNLHRPPWHLMESPERLRTSMDRRDALKLLATVGATAPATLACIRRPEKREPHMSPTTKPTSDRMPSIFLAHGSPILLTDRPWMSELNLWASKLPRPKAILMLSAHWLDKPVTLGATTPVPLVYDFYGFPAEFYKTTYPAPGAPALAARVRALLGPGQTTDEAT